MRKRCVALLLAVLLLGSLAAPALAAGSEPVTSTGTFWQAAAADSPDFIGNVIGVFDKGTCTVSEDRRHHGKVIRKADLVFGEPGAWLALCDYCGENFKVYDDDMQNAYDEHVGQMQKDYGATVISSNGSMYLGGWSFWEELTNDYVISNGSVSFGIPCIANFGYPTKSNWGGIAVWYRCNFVAPVSGTYVFTPEFSANVVSDYNWSCSYLYTSVYSPNPKITDAPIKRLSGDGPLSVVLVAGSAYQLTMTSKFSGTSPFSLVSSSALRVTFPTELSVPNVNSRVGILSGDYGILGDNGTIIKSDTQYIVNETTNIFTNPATGTTFPVSDWSYDYSDRSYHLTLEGGDTVTVTYGDENVTINQGGDTYNIYYIVPGGGEVEPTPTPPPTDPPTPTETISPTDPPGPTEPVDPDAPPDTTGWGILDFLKGIFDFLWGLGEKLMNLLKNLLMALFMPKEESVKELEDKVSEKLPFISDLQDFGDQFSDVLHNPAKSARSMTFTTVVDLGRKSGGISYGSGQANILDMTWYLDYKPIVDDIIEGVAWLVFLWNLYGALPTIIHGGASGLHTTAGLVKWKEENDDVG